MKKLFLGILILLMGLILYLLFYPVNFEPVAYDPPKDPGLSGVFAPNEYLDNTQFLLKDFGFGPEDIAIAPDSSLYTGFSDGRIIKFSRQGKLISTLGNTLGRPLGMELDKSGNLIIADEYKGLIRMDELGNITPLTQEVAGTPIYFADDLVISEEGVVYFTDASQRNHSDEILREFWELQATGRLLSYHPETQETRLELSGLRFANGVALGPDEEYLLVNETVGMQILKYWLKGPKAGQTEIFIDELPGYPDNINYNGAGIFWVGLTGPRNSSFEDLYNKPFLRKVVSRLPEFIHATNETEPMGLVIGINTDGEIIHNLQSAGGHIHSVTSVNQVGNMLFLGNLGQSAIGRVLAPKNIHETL